MSDTHAIPVRGPGSTSESRQRERARARRLIERGLEPGEDPVDPAVVESVGLEMEEERAFASEEAKERRERMAIVALQGLLAGDHERLYTFSVAAKDAVGHADALIAALDAPQQGVGSGT